MLLARQGIRTAQFLLPAAVIYRYRMAAASRHLRKRMEMTVEMMKEMAARRRLRERVEMAVEVMAVMAVRRRLRERMEMAAKVIIMEARPRHRKEVEKKETTIRAAVIITKSVNMNG